MVWGDGGMSDDRLALLSSAIIVQTHIWKITAALKPVLLFNGPFSETASSASTYNFTLFKSTNITTCMPMPYVYLIGCFNFSNGNTYIDCKLYTYINSTVMFESSYKTLMILQQRTHIWLPVNLGRSWAHDPSDHKIVEFFKKLFKKLNT